MSLNPTRRVVSSVPNRVSLIIPVRVPSEVLDAVVTRITVPVTAFQTFRTRANKRLQYETMYKNSFPTLGTRKAQTQMPGIQYLGDQRSAHFYAKDGSLRPYPVTREPLQLSELFHTFSLTQFREVLYGRSPRTG
jgi:hypothetical protein